MKQIITLTVLLLSLQVATAQKLTKESLTQLELGTHKTIVAQALRYQDFQTAINSMQHIIALEGTKSPYKDSLAITYFNAKNYVSSHLLAKELVVSNPNNVSLLEINALSLQNLNANKEAITAYETLFDQTNIMGHGFQLAFLQLGLKRLAEAQATIARTLQCPPLENAYIQLAIDKTQSQNVPLQAAAYNLQGLIAYELKDMATASTAFIAALKIMPEFVLASQNATALEGVAVEQGEWSIKKIENRE